jgi:3-phenylpropionate/trans-cinnamate dioxygenase ferredoxin reductase subunit
MGVVIAGAGHAGGTVAALLRQYGYDRPITLVGGEDSPPYQRPPLSKAWLQGKADPDSILLKPASWYAEHGCAMRMGTEIESIARGGREVRLSDGSTLNYDHLVLATGVSARKLAIPGAALGGIFALRTIADAEQLKQALVPGKRLVLIGGGYVGLEVAASARALGIEVVVIEREPRCLARVASAPLAEFFHAYHAGRGVRFEVGAGVIAFEGGEDVETIRLDDGRSIQCDVAVIGVGAVPNDNLARDAGLLCGDGILVDGVARTSDSAIFAVGDVASRLLPGLTNRIRLESVPNALEQAKQVACAITGREPPAVEVPWFWSDQYDLKLQIAGLAAGSNEQVVRGNPDSGKFAVFHLKDGQVRCVEAVNAAPEFIIGKRLIASGQTVGLDRLMDVGISMKEIAA